MKYHVTEHACERMKERKITAEMVMKTVINGQWGAVRDRKLYPYKNDHVVVGISNRSIITTVYWLSAGNK